MFRISLFIGKAFVGKMKREIAPRLGETIIKDHETLRVINVSHDWDEPDFIQVNTVPFEEKEN